MSLYPCFDGCCHPKRPEKPFPITSRRVESMDFSTDDTGARDKWIIETVEKGFVGEYTSHVLESKDKIHIAYFDYINGDLKHAKRGPDGWLIERVDQEGTVGQYLSIAKDEGRKLYISYRDQGKNRLKMAVFDGNRWNVEVVDNEPFASIDTSIFVLMSGRSISAIIILTRVS
jgi:hypothetical protein